MRVVIALGGSIFCGKEEIDAAYVRTFSNAMSEILSEHKLFIVAGGGWTARNYINAGRELGADESYLDILGIYATRLNASIISLSMLGPDCDSILERIEDVDKEKQVVIMGGTVPGHTTDAVAARLAAHVDADLLIIATNVGGVFDSDPRKYPDAKFFDKLSSEELIEVVTPPEYEAGSTSVVDVKAAHIIHEQGFRTVVLDGRDVNNIIGAMVGKSGGTVIEKVGRT